MAKRKRLGSLGVDALLTKHGVSIGSGELRADGRAITGSRY